MQKKINTRREALDLEAELIAQLRNFPVRDRGSDQADVEQRVSDQTDVADPLLGATQEIGPAVRPIHEE